MPPCFRVLATTLVLFAILAVDLRGRQLLEVDGIELHGTAQLVLSGSGTCNVFESDTSYEERKQNHGAPMDIWRLDFSVHNGSGQWLDHLIARYEIESEWPECTNWDGLATGSFPQSVEWANSNGHIQESGRKVVAPGRTLTATHLFIVLRGAPQPRFSNWSMDFDFAAAPPLPGFGSAAAAQQAVPAASPEQENIFWQSIVDSRNPAMFEAYLAQFPNGVFRALAVVRLAELRAPGSDLPAAKRFPVEAATAREKPAAEARPAEASICSGDRESPSCWKELESHPDCYVWNPNVPQARSVRWTGDCINWRADGAGTLYWKGGSNPWDGHAESAGLLRGGKHTGAWVIQYYKTVAEGSFQDGERHGRWVFRHSDGSRSDVGYLNGLQHGRENHYDSSGRLIAWTDYVRGVNQFGKEK